MIHVAYLIIGIVVLAILIKVLGYIAILIEFMGAEFFLLVAIILGGGAAAYAIGRMLFYWF